MTVLEFIRQHPAQAVDVISSEGCDHVTPKRSIIRHIKQYIPSTGEPLPRWPISESRIM